jgi:predicted glutamine amidotransferase
MLQHGLDDDPAQAVAETVAVIVAEAERANVPAFIRFTAAFSDGRHLYAIRYATDRFAPSLYTATLAPNAGLCVVSEPLDGEVGNWMPVPPNSFVTVRSAKRIAIEPFLAQANSGQVAESV